MKKISIIAYALLIYSCGANRNDILIKIHEGKIDELGVPSGYVNSKGDTIIPVGKYAYCYTDTMRTLGIVMTKENVLIGIDNHQNKLFEVFWFDNGPDYISDGLFRIIKNKKIGYADSTGKIIIKPEFDCAFPFENGIAKVSTKCSAETGGEHSIWKSDDWFYINKAGRKVQQ